MDDIKVFPKKWKRNEEKILIKTRMIYSQDVRIKFGIEKHWKE